jgi:MerR family transcriptional regulator, mercuric resistance operon regulatory protein
MGEREIQIGELARRTSCNIETIRYYERIGILPAPPRRGRYRSYEPEHVSTLSFVRRSRELGFTLDEVRALLGLASAGCASCAEARTLASAHLHDVRARIADLRRMERVLAGAVKACDADSNTGCPLIDSLNGRATTTSDISDPVQRSGQAQGVRPSGKRL